MKKLILPPLCLVLFLCLVQVGVAVPTQTSAVPTTIANVALDQLQANQSIQQAKTMLANVDGLIHEFTVNDGLSVTDPRLAPIINMRDLSAKFISNSDDLFTNGAYSSARDTASMGLDSANEAWTLSLALQAALSNPPMQTGAGTSPSTAATTGAALSTPATPAATSATTIPIPQPTKSGEIALNSVILAGCSLVFIGIRYKRIQ